MRVHCDGPRNGTAISCLVAGPVAMPRAGQRTTYREVWGGGPVGCAFDIADEGLVDVASADEAGEGG